MVLTGSDAPCAYSPSGKHRPNLKVVRREDPVLDSAYVRNDAGIDFLGRSPPREGGREVLEASDVNQSVYQHQTRLRSENFKCPQHLYALVCRRYLIDYGVPYSISTFDAVKI